MKKRRMKNQRKKTLFRGTIRRKNKIFGIYNSQITTRSSISVNKLRLFFMMFVSFVWKNDKWEKSTKTLIIPYKKMEWRFIFFNVRETLLFPKEDII